MADGEATGMCSRRAVRGDRGQRASKVVPGTWEARQGESSGGKTEGLNGRRESITDASALIGSRGGPYE